MGSEKLEKYISIIINNGDPYKYEKGVSLETIAKNFSPRRRI